MNGLDDDMELPCPDSETEEKLRMSDQELGPCPECGSEVLENIQDGPEPFVICMRVKCKYYALTRLHNRLTKKCRRIVVRKRGVARYWSRGCDGVEVGMSGMTPYCENCGGEIEEVTR